jgi:hypothetical protein
MNRNGANGLKTPQPLVHPLYLRELDEQKQKSPQIYYFQRFSNRIFGRLKSIANFSTTNKQIMQLGLKY